MRKTSYSLAGLVCWEIMGPILIDDEADVRAVAEFHADYTAGKAFLVPDDILRRDLAGESPVKLCRLQRNLAQQELSGRVGIDHSCQYGWGENDMQYATGASQAREGSS
jgi:hypothetical protein